MTTPDHDDPWAQPPEWVPLCDLPRWLEWHFQDPGSALELTPEIIRGIRTRELTYRVEGFPYTTGQDLPPGFDCASTPPQRIIVTDWDLVAPDWAAGTVAGPARRIAPGGRYAITVWWNRAQRWSPSLAYVARRSRARESSSDMKASGAAPSPPSADAPAPASANLLAFNAREAKEAGNGTIAAIAPESGPSAFISATELLGLMVYARADGFQPRSGAAFYEVWGMIPSLSDQPEVNSLVLLLQRKSADPKVRKQAGVKPAKWALEPYRSDLATARRRAVKMIQCRGMSADQLRDELVSDIRRFCKDDTSRDRKWNMAARRVCEAIAVGRLEARGIECQFGTKMPNKPRQSIPASDVDPDVCTLVRAESGGAPIHFVDWLIVPRDVPVVEGEEIAKSWAAVSFKGDEAVAWVAAIKRTSAADAEGAAGPGSQEPAPVPHQRATLPDPICWMLSYARNAKESKRLAKRDDAIKACMGATGSTYREARKVWTELPTEMKRTPRDNGRGKGRRFARATTGI